MSCNLLLEVVFWQVLMQQPGLDFSSFHTRAGFSNVLMSYLVYYNVSAMTQEVTDVMQKLW